MIDWLIGTLLATSALIVLVLIVREPVRRHFGARVAYGLWLIPAARLLMPPISQTVERPVSISIPAQLQAPQVSAEPMLLSSVAPAEPSLVEHVGGWPMIIVTLWLGVAIGLFAARMLAFRRERSAILAGAVEVGKLGSIRLVRSPDVTGPVAFGILSRVIAVPADFDRLYAPHERMLALEHELSHHRSGDLVANLFAFVLLCLQWFNPLAWAAHAAFRFDQEAACDARVLDKVKAHDRADYGRAIAKAASGRALLFASALDRRNTLQRRLVSMLSNPTSGRRLAGRLMVLATVAVVLPLTATRAITYVDVPVPPADSVAKVPLVAAAAAVQPVETADPASEAPDFDIKGDGKLVINGKERQWQDLSPEEKAEVRRSLAEAKAELARTRIDREEIQRDIREAMSDARVNQEEMRAELAKARVRVEEALRTIDAQAVEIRRSGEDPERIKAAVRQSLKSVESIDFDAIASEAMRSVNQEAIEASIAAAEASMARAHSQIEQLERRFEKDE